MFWLNFYQIPYIAKLICSFSATISPSFSRSARAESNIYSGISTNILHSNTFVKNEGISEFKVNIQIQYILVV